ncbi:MAG: type II toxin-antitoxin system toxin DNA ADP-ribosyl transferase DarT [Gemmatimonadota bacterium]
MRDIIEDGGLLCDAEMVTKGRPAEAIGMSSIKKRRVERLELGSHPGTKVGDYVPFYFCPRSIMLYVLHRANHPELTYREGQGPIVHMEADLRRVVDWAGNCGRRWAFSLSNAGAFYAEFRSQLEELDQLDWAAIAARDFRAEEVKEKKQAEFLVHGSFPWELVERIGVLSRDIQVEVAALLSEAAHRPAVEIQSDWYF